MPIPYHTDKLREGVADFAVWAPDHLALHLVLVVDKSDLAFLST